MMGLGFVEIQIHMVDFHFLNQKRSDGDANFITVVPGYTALDVSFPDEMILKHSSPLKLEILELEIVAIL